MKKIINKPENYVKEMLEGIYLAHQNQLTFVNNDIHCLVSKYRKKGKVGISTGGGSGHLPLFLGYVGKGMLDGCAIGDVFQSPSAEQMFEITKHIDSGAGVLYIYGNYNGDIFNFDTAAEMSDFEENIKVETVIGWDDVASDGAKINNRNIRRGVAGIFFIYKCAGAAANEMMDLNEVKRIATKARDNVRTMGVGLSACIVPRVGKPGFSIAENEMEIGMGIHGETGIRKGKLLPADDIVEELLNKILADLPYQSGDEVAILINGLGATPLDEQYIVFRKVHEILNKNNISIYHTYIGEYATAMEMAGFSISLLKLDAELKHYISEPADTPFFKQFKIEEMA